MHPINLRNTIKMKENQIDNNELYENRMNRRSIYTSKTIILVVIAIIAGLGLLASIILISIEFKQMHRLSYETSAFSFQTSNFINPTILSTSEPTTHPTGTQFNSSTILSTTTTTTTVMPSTTIVTEAITTTTSTILTTIIQSVSLNTTTTLISIGNLSDTIN